MEYSGSGDVTALTQAVDLVLPPGAATEVDGEEPVLVASFNTAAAEVEALDAEVAEEAAAEAEAEGGDDVADAEAAGAEDAGGDGAEAGDDAG